MAEVEHYVDGAFKFNNRKLVFIFIADQCLLINNEPAPTGDCFIIRGPISIADYFPSLRDPKYYPYFGTGIDAAFTSSRENEVYIFKLNKYILLNFVSGDIIQGPSEITDRFHSFKHTVFESGIDAAFASSEPDEAYVFKDEQYGVINYGKNKDYWVIHPEPIIQGFPFFENKVFQNGFHAAFSVGATNKAYIFKDNTYALINYAGPAKGFIIDPVIPITDGFPCLNGIIPRRVPRN